MTIQTTTNGRATTVAVIHNGKVLKGFCSLSPERANAKRVEWEWEFVHSKHKYN